MNNLAIGQWFEIPNSAMRNADLPNPPGGAQNKVNAWTSFVADPRTSKVYSVANGGHNDYGGNEVDALDMERADPTWTEVLQSSPAVANVEYYPDGTPTSRHTYYSVTFNEFDNRVMLFGGARYGNGFFTNKIDSYNLGTNRYSPAGTHPDTPSVLKGTQAVAADPLTGNAYLLQDNTLGRWNRSSNTIQILNPSSPAGGGEAASAFDTSRGRILFAGGFFVDHHLYTPSTNAWSAITFNGANAANVASGQAMAMFYVPAIDQYLVRRAPSGGTVYQINPSTFEVTTFPTTGGSSIPSTFNGPYNKFLYLPRLGGAVYVPTYDGNAWFLRLH